MAKSPRAPRSQKADQDPPTTGHVWDGIEELDNPMPRWWLWTFYACIVWAIIYTIFYPAWPLISGATPGTLGWSTRGEVAAAIDQVNAANADLDTKLAATPVEAVAADPALLPYATAGGAALFRTNCATCHGAGAAGLQAAGYPNLLDDDWLWGGAVTDIALTLTHGIRWDADGDTRFSAMPPFADLLEPAQITDVAQHVLSLSGQADATATGAALYAENCASCHAEAGTGDREQGAPNLTDAVWLYGSTPEAIARQITAPRNGQMPAWNTRLSEDQIKKLAVYVHGLGGGE